MLKQILGNGIRFETETESSYKQRQGQSHHKAKYIKNKL